MKKVFSIIFSFCAVAVIAGGGGAGATVKFPVSSQLASTTAPDGMCSQGFAKFTSTNAVITTSFNSTCAVAGGCATVGAFAFTGTHRYRLRNTSNSPACIRMEVSGGAISSFCRGLFFAVPFDFTGPLTTCADVPGATGNMGFVASVSPVWYMQVPACSDFTVVYGENANVASCTYTLDVQNTTSPGSIGCVGAECGVKSLTLGGSPVPTMTQWGLFLFGLIVLTLGVVAVFNMSRKSSNETAR